MVNGTSSGFEEEYPIVLSRAQTKLNMRLGRLDMYFGGEYLPMRIKHA
jgi:hypothetical protein